MGERGSGVRVNIRTGRQYQPNSHPSPVFGRGDGGEGASIRGQSRTPKLGSFRRINLFRQTKSVVRYHPRGVKRMQIKPFAYRGMVTLVALLALTGAVTAR